MLRFSARRGAACGGVSEVLQGATGLIQKVLTAAFPYRWGVVQPVGHRTVNADGEGSNPSAPATHFVAFSPGFSMG